jgi:hypothetical protein
MDFDPISTTIVIGLWELLANFGTYYYHLYSIESMTRDSDILYEYHDHHFAMNIRLAYRFATDGGRACLRYAVLEVLASWLLLCI